MASFVCAYATVPSVAKSTPALPATRTRREPATYRSTALLTQRGSSIHVGAHTLGARTTLVGRPVTGLTPRHSLATSSTPVCVCAAAAESLSVAVTGATGFVGSALVDRLTSQGHSVKVLARDVSSSQRKFGQKRGVEVIAGGNWNGAIQGCDAVVNLAGEPISTRWTPTIKSAIMDSRVNVTRKIASAINASTGGPKVLVNASAVGYYGSSETGCFDESSAAGNDYLAQVCINWEKAAAEAKVDRSVILRLGIVLDNGGGAMAKMLPIFQLGAGGPLGDGKQWFSWVHRDDVVGMIMESITNPSWEGVYNVTGPKPVRMGEMCTALGTALAMPSWLPVPAFALQAILGEGATVVLNGQKVLPTRAQESGFKFKYTTIEAAMKAITK